MEKNTSLVTEEQAKEMIKKSAFTVKGVKTFTGHDGIGYEASLYHNNKRVAIVVDDGWGGGIQYHTIKKDNTDYNQALLSLDIFSKTITVPSELFNEGFTYSSDCVIGDLVNEYQTTKRLKRECKTKTLFITTECEKDTYFHIPYKFNAKVKAHLESTYKKELVEIINETIQ